MMFEVQCQEAPTLRRRLIILLASICLLAVAGAGSLRAQSIDEIAAAAAPTYQQLWKRGEYQRALTAVDKQLTSNTLEAWYLDAFIDRAELLFEVGRVDDAITQMEQIARRFPDPAQSMPLALYYKYRGRTADYERTLKEVAQQAQNPVHFTPALPNALALARFLEIQGQNPKQILSAYLDVIMKQLPNEASPYVEAGDLSYRKYSYDVAAEYYNKALKLEPANQDALAGLAECYWKSSDPRIEETLKKLEALNPNHPRALAIAVEELLDDGNGPEALKLAAKQLAVNPNDLHFLSLKAAGEFLKNDSDGILKTQKAILDFNPHYSEAFSVPARIASRHYRFNEAATMLNRAVELDPDDHAARGELAFDLLRLGKQSEGAEQLELAFKADPFNVHAFNMLQVLDTMEKFKTIRRGPFVVQLPQQDVAAMGEEIMSTVEKAAKLYETKYDVKLTSPVVIQMFDDHDQFMVRSIGLPGNTGHLGICFGQLLTLDSPRARPPGAANWRDVLWHEFVHVVTLQKTKNRMPRWLSEGISVYEETQASPAWGEKLDVRYKTIIEADGFPKVSELEQYFTRPKTQFHLLLGYFEAGEFVKFYIDTYGIAAMNTCLERIAEGAEANAALVAASKVSAETLDAKFLEHMEKRCAALKNLPTVVARNAGTTQTENGIAPPPPPMMVASAADWQNMPSPFTDAMRAAAAAIDKELWTSATAHLLQADKLFPEYNAEDAPLRELARVYAKQRQLAKAREMLEQMLARDANSLDDCHALIAIQKSAKDWDGVVKTAQLAFNINPFDVENLRNLREAQIAKGDAKAALATVSQLEGLDTAHALDYRLERAQLLLKSGDRVAAKQATLALLEEMPYYWEAQQLLLTLSDVKVEAPDAAAIR